MTKKTGLPTIDHLVLDQIRMFENSGGSGLLCKVIVLYFYDSQKHMEKVQSSVENYDMKSLRLAAHALKSSSANVGAIGVFGICQEIDEELSAGSILSTDSPLLKRLKEEYDMAFLELRGILDSEDKKAKENL